MLLFSVLSRFTHLPAHGCIQATDGDCIRGPVNALVVAGRLQGVCHAQVTEGQIVDT